MTRLTEALARLERAVARLETVYAGIAGEGEAGRLLARPEAGRRWPHEAAIDPAARPEGTLLPFGRASGEGEER